MNVIEPAIMDILINDTGVTAIVGSRIYTSLMPDNVTYPAVVFFEVSGLEMAEAEVARSRFQFSGYAKTEIEAKQLSNVIIDALKNITKVHGSIVLPKTIYLGRNRLHDTEMNLYHFATDFMIASKE